MIIAGEPLYTAALHAPVISIIIWKEDTLLPAVFNPSYSSMNQRLFEKN